MLGVCVRILSIVTLHANLIFLRSTILPLQSCRRLACTVVPIVLRNTVYYAVLLMMKDQLHSKSVERTKTVE